MAAYQAPPSMRFSRQEYWSGVPLPSLFRHIPTRIWNIHPYKNLYTNVHIIALFIISKKWKKSKWLSTDEWINKMWYMSTQWKIKLFSYIKEIVIHAMIWMNLENIMLSEWSQSQKNSCCVYGHTTLNAPDLFWSRKNSCCMILYILYIV